MTYKNWREQRPSGNKSHWRRWKKAIEKILSRPYPEELRLIRMEREQKREENNLRIAASGGGPWSQKAKTGVGHRGGQYWHHQPPPQRKGGKA